MRETTESAIDRALSDFLTERSGLVGAEKQAFAGIVRTLSGALGDGHSCIELDETEHALVCKSRMVSDEAVLPLVLFNSRLYLARYFSYESRLVKNLQRISAITYEFPDLDEMLDLCFTTTAAKLDYQRQAARCALSKAFTIIAGGPGTGKTTTIVKIVGLLLSIFGSDLKIALAAPTGKAAIRMRESISTLVPLLSFDDDIREAIPQEALTLHRLLGARRFSPGFKHDRENPLPWDVVLVDEASMVDLALMSKLVDALKENSRLILLGDKDQLASVESGAVLADCIEALPGNVVELRTSFRFDEEISALARAVNSGDSETVWNYLDAGRLSVLQRAGENWLEQVFENYARYMTKAQTATTTEDYLHLFDLFNRFRVLCGVRNGKRGVSGINTQVEALLTQHGFPAGKDQWYVGRPIIISRNDYSKRLFNGDIGLCLPDPERNGALAVWFEQNASGPGKTSGLHRFPPTRVPACETVWAMTIHKSQGSEFDEVLIVLPDQDNQVLSRELLYTAVTRARKSVRILVEKEICALMVKRKTKRYSGLAERLATPPRE